MAADVIVDDKGRKGVSAKAFYLVDPGQSGGQPLKPATIFVSPSGTGDAAGFLSVMQGRIQVIQASVAGVQGATTSNPIYDLSNFGTHAVSGTNAIMTITFDTKGLKSMALIMTSTGTSTVVIHGSMDNFATQDVTVDSIATSAATTKQYDDTHLASTLAVNPMLFRFIKIVIGAAGGGFVSTVEIACK